jgi:hypothetical protein
LLLWPIELVLHAGKRWLGALISALVRWIIHRVREW